MTPKKKSKNNPLTDEDKELNTLISSIRITVEHVNSQLKIFRILSERYRSRINTFYSRFLIICSFYNLCLDTQFRKKSNSFCKLKSLISTATFFIFLSTSAKTRIISTYFFLFRHRINFFFSITIKSPYWYIILIFINY